MRGDGMYLDVWTDRKFEQHFRNLLQVFLYITDECNLRCKQCYYKPWLHSGCAEMETDVMLALLHKFRELGAMKLSLLGGEPTLYGQVSGNESLPYIVRQAKKLGFNYIRLVTNGLFDEGFLRNEDLKLLNEVTFSIDGDSPEIHDPLRGQGTFIRTTRNLQSAIGQGYVSHVTTCVHRGNIGQDGQGHYLLDRAIKWATILGAKLINFHPLFKMNIPRDTWTGDVHITAEEWVSVYRHIRRKVQKGEYSIPVRIPQRFINLEQFNRQPKYYGFCPVKLAERVEVHPNGQIHSCALNNGTPISLAKFTRENDKLRILWSLNQNELEVYPFDFSKDHPCAVISKDYGELVPLCISFKPGQEEFIWKTVGLS